MLNNCTFCTTTCKKYSVLVQQSVFHILAQWQNLWRGGHSNCSRWFLLHDLAVRALEDPQFNNGFHFGNVTRHERIVTNIATLSIIILIILSHHAHHQHHCATNLFCRLGSFVLCLSFQSAAEPAIFPWPPHHRTDPKCWAKWSSGRPGRVQLNKSKSFWNVPKPWFLVFVVFQTPFEWSMFKPYVRCPCPNARTTFQIQMVMSSKPNGLNDFMVLQLFQAQWYSISDSEVPVVWKIHMILKYIKMPIPFLVFIKPTWLEHIPPIIWFAPATPRLLACSARLQAATTSGERSAPTHTPVGFPLHQPHWVPITLKSDSVTLNYTSVHTYIHDHNTCIYMHTCTCLVWYIYIYT